MLFLIREVSSTKADLPENPEIHRYTKQSKAKQDKIRENKARQKKGKKN